jgi:hypothetical protein
MPIKLYNPARKLPTTVQKSWLTVQAFQGPAQTASQLVDAQDICKRYSDGATF